MSVHILTARLQKRSWALGMWCFCFSYSGRPGCGSSVVFCAGIVAVAGESRPFCGCCFKNVGWLVMLFPPGDGLLITN